MKAIRRTDLIISAVIVLFALLFFLLNKQFFARKGEYAEIYHDSTLVYRIELSTAKEGTFSIPAKPEVVFRIYADKSIAFIQSDCPDKVCIRSGRLRFAGQLAACLPNKVLLKIVSGDENREGPDIIIE